MKKKSTRRRTAGELNPEQARLALVRMYAYTQREWQSELFGQNPDWMRLFSLHNDLVQLETNMKLIREVY